MLVVTTRVSGTIGLGAWGVILLLGLLIERWRYKPLGERSPGPEWTATGERFVDPETGKLVAVYYHPEAASGATSRCDDPCRASQPSRCTPSGS